MTDHQPITSGLLIGEAREQMRTLPAGCVHCVCTSPPYWSLRDYQIPPVLWADGTMAVLGLEPTPEAFIAHMVELFGEVKRILRDDGVAFVNLGDSYASNWPCSRVNKIGNESLENGTRENRPSRLGGVKEGDLLNLPHRVAAALQADGWYWRSTIVWCLSGGTWLYARTAKGDAPAMLKDLVRLDPKTVQLWNGEKWTGVVSWTRNETTRGSKRGGKYLEIELRSGERIGCTAEHHWPTNRGLLQAHELKVGDIIPISTLPGPEQSNETLFDDAELGWLVGFYIAEGMRTEKGMRFAVHQKEVEEFETIRRLAEYFDGTAVMRKLAGHAASIDVYCKPLAELVCQYVTGENCYNKRLSRKAWMRPNDFLEFVLEGYLKGDGHWDSKNNRWRLGFSNNDGLAVDLRCACARVGYRCRLKRTKHSLGARKFPGWRGSIVRKPTIHQNTKDNGQIVAIRSSRAREFWDIEVADEPHLFALASGVLTHNCKRSPMPESINGWRWVRCRVKISAQVKGKQNGAIYQARSRDMSNGQYLGSAVYEPCPGCDKCNPNDGYVLRRGKWRPTTAHEYIFLLSKSERYFCDGDAVQELCTGNAHNRGHGVNLKAKEGGQVPRIKQNESFSGAVCNVKETRNPRSVWTLSSEPYKEAHFATFPTVIPKRCIEAGTSTGGCCPACESPYAPVVDSERVATRHGDKTKVTGDRLTDGNRDPQRHVALKNILGYRPTCQCDAGDPIPCMVFDPFTGSGTTLQVARVLGRRYLGTEIKPEYAALAEKRINTLPKWATDKPKRKPKPVDAKQQTLFGEAS